MKNKVPVKVKRLLDEVVVGKQNYDRPQDQEIISKRITVREIVKNFERNIFVYPEEFQRDKVTTWSNFGREFISRVFSQFSTDHGISYIDKLHIAEWNDKSETQKQAVIEGGQRTRAFYDFFVSDRGNKLTNNLEVVYNKVKYDLSNKSYKDLQEVEKYDDNFKDYMEDVKSRTFDVSYYRGFSTQELSKFFSDINNRTTLKDQELRNAFGGEACVSIRRIARQTASSDPDKVDKLHPLFETITKNYKVRGRWMKINTAHFEYEKILASLLYFEYNFHSNKFIISDKTLDEFYVEFSCNTNDENVNQERKKTYRSLLKKTLDRLTTIFNMVKMESVEKNTGMILTKGDLFTLYGLLYHMEHFYLKDVDYSINPRKFYKWFWHTHYELSKTKEIDKVTQKYVESQYGLKVRKAARKKDELECIFSYWREEFSKLNKADYENIGITVKDKTRCLNYRDTLTVYLQQDYKDAVTGKEMPIDELCRGHIVAHSKGGETNIENTVLLNSYDNNQQGIQNFNEYINS